MDGTAASIRSPLLPLNTFQRLVRQWDHIHPYNAAQVLKLNGPADAQRSSAAWEQTLEALGLGRVTITHNRVMHHSLNGEMERFPVRVLSADSCLCTDISAQLNTPFDDAASPPFRPFILNRGDHHYLGVVYHHWVADSVSIRLLLREWFLRLYAPAEARKMPISHAPGGYWSIFGSHRANWALVEGLLTSVRWTARNRRVARIEHPQVNDFTARFSLHEAGAGLVEPLLAYARRHSATLNDLFLAVVAQACNQFVPLRRTTRRTDLALGTIVDLRPYVRRDLSETFGLFLGFTSTLCRPRDMDDFPRLLQHIATQSRLHKETGLPLSSPLRMLAALVVGRFYSRRKMVEFYRKRVPLAGGISNVNLNRTWAARFHPDPLLDYIRVSPTGPMMPLVFTPTTLGQHLHFGLTYRPALIPPDQAQNMASFFLNRLRQIADYRL